MAASAKLRLVQNDTTQPEVVARVGDTAARAPLDSALQILQASVPEVCFRTWELVPEMHGAPSVQTATANDAGEAVNGNELFSGFSRQNHAQLSGYFRTEANPAAFRQSLDDQDALLLSPCISLAPFQAQGNNNLRLLPASLPLDIVTSEDAINQSALVGMLERFLKLKEFFELDDLTLFYDDCEPSTDNDRALEKISGVLQSRGHAACRIMSLEKGLAALVAKPQKFGAILTISKRGTWVEGIAQSLVGNNHNQARAWIGDKTGFYGCSHNQGRDHGAAKSYAPNAFVLAGVLLLVEQGLVREAATLFNGWLRCVEDGIHTEELFQFSPNARRVDTDGFAAAVVERLGEEPRKISGLKEALKSDGPKAPIVSLQLVK